MAKRWTDLPPAASPGGRGHARVAGGLRRALLLLAACSVWMFASCGPPPRAEPPLPAHLDQLEKTLAERIRGAAARIREAGDEPANWMELGNIYFAHGLYDLATQCYDAAEPLGNPNAKFFYVRGYARMQIGRFDEALSDLERVIALNPGYLPAYWRSGLTLLDRGDLDAAERQFRRAMAADDSDARSWIGLARVHLARGRDDEAIRILEPLLGTQPRFAGYINHLLGAAYRRVGRVEDSRRAIQASGGGFEIDDPWVFELGRYKSAGFGNRFTAVQKMIRAGNVERAVQILEQLRAEDPNHAIVLGALGAAYLMQKEYDKSIEYSDLALEKKPDYGFAHENLALAYHIKSLTDSPRAAEFDALASRHIDRTIELNPYSTSALFIKGRILARNGRYDEAIRAYRKAYRMGGRSESRFFRRTRQGYVPRNAIDWLLEAGKLEWKLERWDDSIRTFTEVIEHRPDSSVAHYYLGIAYMKTGRLDEAERSLATADRLSPGSSLVEEAMKQLRALEQERTEAGR